MNSSSPCSHLKCGSIYSKALGYTKQQYCSEEKEASMSTNEAEQPTHTTTPAEKISVRVVKPHQFDSNTPQTPGMQRLAPISKELHGPPATSPIVPMVPPTTY